MKKRHRIFIAINLPADIKKVLAKFGQKWADLPAKWVQEDNLHITLSFLGDLFDEELGEVCMAVKEVAQKHQAFDINLQKIEYGPDDKILLRQSSGQAPRMVWASGEKNQALSSLKRELENSLAGAVRFKPETKTFSPHVTLAKISIFAWRAIEPEERPEVNEDIDLIFTVESIEVMESELTRGGPRYVVIESYQLP